jgi:hypothetical protein
MNLLSGADADSFFSLLVLYNNPEFKGELATTKQDRRMMSNAITALSRTT